MEGSSLNISKKLHFYNEDGRPDEGVDEGCGKGDAKPCGEHPDKAGDVSSDNVSHHPTLQLGHVDGEEGANNEDEGVQGEQACLHRPQARDHDADQPLELVKENLVNRRTSRSSIASLSFSLPSVSDRFSLPLPAPLPPLTKKHDVR